MGGVWSGTALCTVGKLPGDEEAALASYLHAINAQVQAGNDTTAHALDKAIGLAGFLFLFAVGAHHGLAIVIEDRHRRVVIG